MPREDHFAVQPNISFAMQSVFVKSIGADHFPRELEQEPHAPVTLIGQARVPDLVIAGSHCVALDAVLSALSAQGISARTIAIGSMGGVAAARRGECDLAPTHLVDPATGVYNAHLLRPGLALVKGWQRTQGRDKASLRWRMGDGQYQQWKGEF